MRHSGNSKTNAPLSFLLCGLVLADDPNPSTAVTDQLQQNIDLVRACVVAFLVFFMQAGFAMVKTGFIGAKNSVSTLMENCTDFAIGNLAFFLFPGLLRPRTAAF
jgi:hypothetical protein